MASASAQGFQSITSTAGIVVFTKTDSVPCGAFRVECHNYDATNTAISTPRPIWVNVAGVHAAGEFVPVMPGQSKTWANKPNGITQVTVKVNTSGYTSVISADVVANYRS